MRFKITLSLYWLARKERPQSLFRGTERIKGEELIDWLQCPVTKYFFL